MKPRDSVLRFEIAGVGAWFTTPQGAINCAPTWTTLVISFLLLIMLGTAGCGSDNSGQFLGSDQPTSPEGGSVGTQNPEPGPAARPSRSYVSTSLGGVTVTTSSDPSLKGPATLRTHTNSVRVTGIGTPRAAQSSDSKIIRSDPLLMGRDPVLQETRILEGGKE